jgi:hypothetical protein
LGTKREFWVAPLKLNRNTFTQITWLGGKGGDSDEALVGVRYRYRSRVVQWLLRKEALPGPVPGSGPDLCSGPEGLQADREVVLAKKAKACRLRIKDRQVF